jgi:hypothetical protein
MAVRLYRDIANNFLYAEWESRRFIAARGYLWGHLLEPHGGAALPSEVYDSIIFIFLPI